MNDCGIPRLIGVALALSWTIAITAQEVQVPVQERPVTPEQASKLPVVNLPVRAFKLLNASSGWVLTGNRVLLTTDSGESWREISPKEGGYAAPIDVLFLDATTGWILYKARSGDADFTLAITSDGGETWTSSNIKIPVPSPESGGPMLAGNGQLAFSDRLHGWLLIDFQTSSAFSSGGLYTTADGGLTWGEAKNEPGFFGTIRAFPNGDLWALAGDFRDLLVSKHGTAFQAVDLPAPPIVAPAAGPHYSLPTFSDDSHGFLAVTYEGTSKKDSAAALFITADGGDHWAADRALLNLERDREVQTVTGDSTWFVPSFPGGTQPSVLRVRPNDRVTAPPQTAKVACAASFASADHGWMNCGGELSSTIDGGNSWISISPRACNKSSTERWSNGPSISGLRARSVFQ